MGDALSWAADFIANVQGKLSDAQVAQAIASCQQSQKVASAGNATLAANEAAKCKGEVTAVVAQNNALPSDLPTANPDNMSQWLILGGIGVASLAILLSR